jgi:ribosomal protein S18 acetylase RimI-like enzyme
MLRTALPDDHSALAALGLKVWLQTYSERGLNAEIAEYVLSKFTLAAMAALITDPQVYLPVIEHEQHLLAYAVLKANSPCPADPDLTLELSTMYVQESANRQTHGSQLWQACLHEQQKRQPDMVIWLRVNSKNQRALNFYAKHGFQKIGSVWIDFDGEHNENYLLKHSLR